MEKGQSLAACKFALEEHKVTAQHKASGAMHVAAEEAHMAFIEQTVRQRA